MSSTQEVGEIFGEGSGPAQSMLRSPTVLIASVGLWGMNVFMFRLFGIDYVRVLNLDLIKEREEQEKSSTGGSIEAVRKMSDSSDAEAIVTAVDENSHVTMALSDEELENDDYSIRNEPAGGSVTWSKLVLLSISLLILLHFTIYIWIQALGGGSIGAVFAFYGAVTLGIVVPLPSTRWLRKATVTVLQRAFELINPRCSCVAPDPAGPRPIPFIDVFFADAMCSLSKVFFDWGMLWHMAAHYPDPVPKELDTILIPSFCAAIPYIIRARQCLIMLTVGKIKNDPKRYQHFLNAIKYSTSIFPLCLSAFQQTLHPDKASALDPLLIVLLIINASYSLVWDVVMDWGMMKNPAVVMEHSCVSSPSSTEMRAPSCGHAVLRPRLRFGVFMSSVILLSDVVLRFSWTLRFWESSLFPSKDHFVLATQFLEVFRRAIWNLLRVEWENLKQTESKKKTAKGEGSPFIAAPKKVEIPDFHGHRA